MIPEGQPWALVTGATAGIGFGVAQYLVRCGWNVAVAGRNLESSQQVASELDGSGVHTLGLSADLTEVGQVAAMVEEFAEWSVSAVHRGVVANGAAWSTSGPMRSLDKLDDRYLSDYWEAHFATRFRVVNESRRVLGGGDATTSVVSISTVAGACAISGEYLIGAAAAGWAHFTSTAALELEKFGMRINNLQLGATGAGREVTRPSGYDAGHRRSVRTALHEAQLWPISDQDVGRAVAFLLDRDTRMTGLNLPLAGGTELHVVGGLIAAAHRTTSAGC